MGGIAVASPVALRNRLERVRADARLYANIIERTPQHRFGEPDAVAGAAIFLASSASDFVTGQTIAVDGGYSIA